MAPTVKKIRRIDLMAPLTWTFVFMPHVRSIQNDLLSSHLINQFLLSTHVVKTTNTTACNSDWHYEGGSWTRRDRDMASLFGVSRHILTPVMPTVPISPQTSSLQIVSKPVFMFVQGRFLSIPALPMKLFYYCLVHLCLLASYHQTLYHSQFSLNLASGGK